MEKENGKQIDFLKCDGITICPKMKELEPYEDEKSRSEVGEGRQCRERDKIKIGDASADDSAESLALTIFDMILQDWMHGFQEIYTREDYSLLLVAISELIVKGLPIKFFLPGFPAKSSNKKEKVFGVHADFGEFLALRHLLATARKIEAIYRPGVVITILSDFHTFDKFICVSESEYNAYKKCLKTMINNIGADDVIQTVYLSDFPEFKDTPSQNISTKLLADFGDSPCFDDFSKTLSKNPDLREKYLGLKKFMLSDLGQHLPGAPNSTATKCFIRNVSRGMLCQGIALDCFLKKQTFVTNFIRLSIHNHHPKCGKHAINLYKNYTSSPGIPRTPWHHVVAFDSLTGNFVVDKKANVIGAMKTGDLLIKVQMNGKDWFYLVLCLSNEYAAEYAKPKGLDGIRFEADMIRSGCGLILRNKSKDRLGKPIYSNSINGLSLRNMVKEFGVVVLRGFHHFENEKDFIDSYNERLSHGVVHWKFGALKRVNPNSNVPGFVNSKESLPIHFDFSNPPPYMAISQADYNYEDYICREFVLYCKENSSHHNEGATTFVDAHGVAQAMNGRTNAEWKKTVLSYETTLAEVSAKRAYFGGDGSAYKYPLVIQCPWTGRDVLRWGQSWTKLKNPETSQYIFVKIESSPTEELNKIEDLENQIESIAFDDRFFFSHVYQETDQVYVNNYTMLHGRDGFSSSRELWRLQAVPPSHNLPAYFRKVK